MRNNYVKSSQQINSMLGQLHISPDDQNIDDKIEILNQIFTYPSIIKAQRHYSAKKLGTYDLKSAYIKLNQQFLQNKQLSLQRCDCCHNIIQPQLTQELIQKYGYWNWFSTPMNEIISLGVSSRLYFQNLSLSCFFWFISFLIYGVFSLTTNILSYTNSQNCTSLSMCGIVMIKLGSKLNIVNQKGRQYQMIQDWLGLGMVIIWVCFYLYKSFRQREVCIQQDDMQKTASDFTVIIYNLPKQYSVIELQQKFSQYLNSPDVKKYILQNPLIENQNYQQKLEIYSINYAKSFKQLQQIFKTEKQDINVIQFNSMRNQLKSWILNYQNKVPLDKQNRRTFFNRIYQLMQQIENSQKKLIKWHANKTKDINENSQNICFVTFKTNFSRIYLSKFQRNTLYRKIKNWILNIYVPKLMIDGVQLEIQRSPQSQDIIWQNVGFSLTQIIIRKAITYFLTMVILGISFVCIYYLSILKQNTNGIISVWISVFITVVNMIIGRVIQLLSKSQRDYRITYYQINYAFKITLAQLINTIVLSIIANYYIKKNIYQPEGLSQDVFYISVSNMIIPPILKIIDPLHILRKLQRWYYNRPNQKLDFQEQKKFNEYFEGYQFEVGYQYVYILKTSIFTAFFLSLQPIIIIFAAIGLFLMYFAQKYALFQHCSRPKPSSDLINSALNQIHYVTIIAYSLGSFTWINFLPQKQSISIPNIICLSIGMLVLIFPFQEMMVKCIKKKNPLQFYEQQRKLISDEYQRSNPFTHSMGIKNLQKYLQKTKGNLNHCMNQYTALPDQYDQQIPSKEVQSNKLFFKKIKIVPQDHIVKNIKKNESNLVGSENKLEFKISQNLLSLKFKQQEKKQSRKHKLLLKYNMIQAISQYNANSEKSSISKQFGIQRIEQDIPQNNNEERKLTFSNNKQTELLSPIGFPTADTIPS